VVLKNSFSAFAQHVQRDAEALIRFLRAGHGLKQQVHGRAVLQRRQLRGDMRQAAGLRRDFVSIDQPVQRVENGADGLHRIGGRVHADHGIATAIEQPIQGSQQNAGNVIRRMVGLQPDSQHARLAHGVTAARDHANLGRGQHQVFVAHQLGYSRRNLRRDRPLQALQVVTTGFIAQDELAQLAYRHALDGLECLAVVGFENQPGYIVDLGRDQRRVDDLPQREVGQRVLGGDALLLCSRRDSGKPVARFLFIGPGKEFAEAAEFKGFLHATVPIIRHFSHVVRAPGILRLKLR
jgi:hypothetical protein